MKWNSVVGEVFGTDKDGVTGVRLKSTVGGPSEKLEAGGMFVAIGHTPNTAFLGGQLELRRGGYVEVDAAVPDLHERRGRLRGRRRGGQLRTGRPSRRPGRGAWRRWTRSAGWRSRGSIEGGS